MRGLVASEWQRISQRKVTVVLFIIYLCVMALMAWFLLTLGERTVFYTKTESDKVNSLNVMWFFLKENSFFLSLIVFPILFLDSLSSEYYSGAYRFILLRPVPRWKLLLSKWIAQIIHIFIYVLVTWLASMLIGQLFLPKVSHVHFYQDSTLYSSVDAYGYAIAFYFMYILIQVASLGVCSLISMLIPNTAFSFLVLAGLYVGIGYLSTKLLFFLNSFRTLILILGPDGALDQLVAIGLILVFSYALSLLLWTKRDVTI